MTKIEWQSSTNDALKSLEDMESLEEAKKAIKQNESAIRLLAEQRDKTTQQLQEARKLLTDCLDYVPIELGVKIEQSNQEEH